MLTTEELKTIREALPYNAVKLIKAKIKVSEFQLSRTLNKVEHYRKDIIDAALEVIKEHRADIEQQRSLISELAS